ncbi:MULTISPECIES: helix-turn-helix domain-containing protein [unclassified Rathayibacter]|uniref:helix-turn-helix domain-containing protein n=1 Tax=unclassified Rathayibacter TaxID=2609250 RepID=UPI000F4CBAA7|nr:MULTISPECIES: helix-turn-helix domain-containing protein [unclassified Rathayibacter]MCJ1703764.1 helix-turn-helix domain-containing protein [Rathayibacter sp. VKM Ac-2926]ROP48199.1 PucR-like helix-turn-helix protein [Rathayibacter sp. PhB186]ROS48615.1 PucR-like helix-turn-helix protein [Rathayibacter sp. PhB185]TCL82723.1 PucR-like helix-turn-helix protein [Rathayibacter sp. PhB192]TCM28062.1 PucR-like helix-turn-helix protein [Rathayibacter sp. PhB179]
MQGLMVKLLNVDTPGERALRVVAYFDQLASNNPDLDAVVRATAVLADCPAGVELPSRGLSTRYSSDGALLAGSAAHVSQHANVDAGSNEHGTLWLERGDTRHELDEFILERFALTVTAVLARQRPSGGVDAASGLSDPALAQLLVNARSTEAERSRAARLIGLQPATSIQLIAVESEGSTLDEPATRFLRTAWQRPVHIAPLSKHLSLVIAVGSEPVDWTAAHGITGRAASGPIVGILDAPRSWVIARDTLRFAGATSSWPRLLDSDTLGALRLVSSLDPAVVAEQPDVIHLERLASGPHGAEAIDILDHYLHADSLRSAARAANFHHSSMQGRITRLGQALQVDLRSPAGRERMAVAMLIWRLFRSHNG